MTRSSAPLARFSETTFDEISAVRKIFRIVSSTNLTRATQLDSVIHWSILFTLDAIKWRWFVDVQPSSVREILFALKPKLPMRHKWNWWLTSWATRVLSWHSLGTSHAYASWYCWTPRQESAHLTQTSGLDLHLCANSDRSGSSSPCPHFVSHRHIHSSN